MLSLLVVLITLLYIPPIQGLITNKAEQVLERKLQTEVHIGAINLNLFGNLILKDIYIKDPDKQKIFEVEAIDTELAVLHYELWKMTHQDGYRQNALTLYQNLYKDTPNIEYKTRVEEMRQNVPKNYYSNFYYSR